MSGHEQVKLRLLSLMHVPELQFGCCRIHGSVKYKYLATYVAIPCIHYGGGTVLVNALTYERKSLVNGYTYYCKNNFVGFSKIGESHINCYTFPHQTFHASYIVNITYNRYTTYLLIYICTYICGLAYHSLSHQNCLHNHLCHRRVVTGLYTDHYIQFVSHYKDSLQQNTLYQELITTIINS